MSRWRWSRSIAFIFDSHQPKWMYMWFIIVCLFNLYSPPSCGMFNPRCSEYRLSQWLHWARRPPRPRINLLYCSIGRSVLHLVQILCVCFKTFFNCGFSVFLQCDDLIVCILYKSNGVANQCRVVHFFNDWNHFTLSDWFAFANTHVDNQLRDCVACFQIYFHNITFLNDVVNLNRARASFTWILNHFVCFHFVQRLFRDALQHAFSVRNELHGLWWRSAFNQW